MNLACSNLESFGRRVLFCLHLTKTGPLEYIFESEILEPDVVGDPISYSFRGLCSFGLEIAS